MKGNVLGFGGSTKGSPEFRTNMIQFPFLFPSSALPVPGSYEQTIALCDMWGAVLSLHQTLGHWETAALLDFVSDPHRAYCAVLPDGGIIKCFFKCLLSDYNGTRLLNFD